MTGQRIFIQKFETPVGNVILGSYRDKLCICDWPNSHSHITLKRIKTKLGADCVDGGSETIDIAIGQLQEYFGKTRQTFHLPTLLCGSEFQVSVWNLIKDIPYGATESYLSVARRLGNPAAVRAVANAVGTNPLSIIFPCHRIVGSGSYIGGYAGGVDTKIKLLKLESNER